MMFFHAMVSLLQLYLGNHGVAGKFDNAVHLCVMTIMLFINLNGPEW